MLSGAEQQLGPGLTELVVVAAIVLCTVLWYGHRQKTGMMAAAPAAAAAAAVLTDVHVGLSAPPVQCTAVVGLSYAYHHYCGPPDYFDDRGWGCAYRSCQTLISALLGTTVVIPTVRDLQERLVEVRTHIPA
jgi:hypothetical protein|eukprot:COSAG01_NODE_1605_length_9753_cov_46.460798_9_plen_132_part_00